MRMTKAIWLVHLVFGYPKSSPFKSYLRGSNFYRIYGSGFLQLSHLVPNQGLDFLKIQPLKRYGPRKNRCSMVRHNFPCKEIIQIPNFAETLISFRWRGERFSPCESCPIQVSSDTMLIFHMLHQISLVFNPNSQQQHMQNH